ncbi:hypothetical protein YQE_12437, partial [Dendroctonus ponderosae]
MFAGVCFISNRDIVMSHHGSSTLFDGDISMLWGPGEVYFCVLSVDWEGTSACALSYIR